MDAPVDNLLRCTSCGAPVGTLYYRGGTRFGLCGPCFDAAGKADVSMTVIIEEPPDFPLCMPHAEIPAEHLATLWGVPPCDLIDPDDQGGDVEGERGDGG